MIILFFTLLLTTVIVMDADLEGTLLSLRSCLTIVNCLLVLKTTTEKRTIT